MRAKPKLNPCNTIQHLNWTWNYIGKNGESHCVRAKTDCNGYRDPDPDPDPGRVMSWGYPGSKFSTPFNPSYYFIVNRYVSELANLMRVSGQALAFSCVLTCMSLTENPVHVVSRRYISFIYRMSFVYVSYLTIYGWQHVMDMYGDSRVWHGEFYKIF